MTSRTRSSSPPVICGSHQGIRVRGSVFTLARGRGQLPHLRHDALAVPLADRADRDPGVHRPRLEHGCSRRRSARLRSYDPYAGFREGMTPHRSTSCTREGTTSLRYARCGTPTITMSLCSTRASFEMNVGSFAYSSE